jgi:hypothetical protein
MQLLCNVLCWWLRGCIYFLSCGMQLPFERLLCVYWVRHRLHLGLAGYVQATLGAPSALNQLKQ